MKQTYVKPRIYVERFTLTQSIAANCGVGAEGTAFGKPTASNGYDCIWDVGGVPLFLDLNDACMQKVKDDEIVNGYCYNNPESHPAIFGSM